MSERVENYWRNNLSKFTTFNPIFQLLHNTMSTGGGGGKDTLETDGEWMAVKDRSERLVLYKGNNRHSDIKLPPGAATDTFTMKAPFVILHPSLPPSPRVGKLTELRVFRIAADKRMDKIFSAAQHVKTVSLGHSICVKIICNDYIMAVVPMWSSERKHVTLFKKGHLLDDKKKPEARRLESSPTSRCHPLHTTTTVSNSV